MSKSSTITKEKPYQAVFTRPEGGWQFQYVTAHPGEILREEFMIPLKLTGNALAIRLGIPPTRLHAILHEKRSVTPDTALRLSRCLGMSPQFWLNVQMSHDLSKARLQGGARIEAEVKPLPRPDLAEAA